MLATVLEILANNAVIQAPELGVLAQTSKEMNNAVSQDCVWQPLCLAKWPITKDVPEEFKKALGYRSLYEEWSEPMTFTDEEDWSPLPPPSCKAEDLALIIQVFYDGKVVASQKLPASNFKEFLDCGCTKVHFENSSTICKAQWDKAEPKPKYFCFDESIEERKFSWNIHLLRYTDFSMRRIGEFSVDSGGLYVDYESGECYPLLDDSGVWSPSAKFDINKEQKPLTLWFDERLYFLALKDTKMALEIVARMKLPIVFGLELECEVQGEGNLVFVRATVDAKQANENGTRRNEYNSLSEEVQKHGATLLHYLSELDTFSYE